MLQNELRESVRNELLIFKKSFSNGLLDSIISDIELSREKGRLFCEHNWGQDIINVINKFI